MQERGSATNPSGGSSQVSLEDFAEAVTKGVMRALQADDVGGYALSGPAGGAGAAGISGKIVRGPIIFGIWFPEGPYGPGGFGGLPGGQAGQFSTKELG